MAAAATPLRHNGLGGLAFLTDVHNSAQRSYNMSRIQCRDTKPEIRARYRLHVKDLPGKPDLVFPAARTVLFVHGCFWHMHRCKYGKPVPATNQTFWTEKRRSNVDRDKRNRRHLRADGWTVFEIWECHTRQEDTMRKKLVPLVKFLQTKKRTHS
jgi:DNA mismatch endonuclease (patch repair protein)